MPKKPIIIKPVPKPLKGAKGAKARKPLQNGRALDKQTILTLLTETYGNIARTADSIGTTRQTIYDWIEKDPELRKARNSARERFKDALEETAWDRALEGKDTTLQIFMLKTQCRERGYDQEDASRVAKDIANEAFTFIVNQTKNPVDNNSSPKKQ